MCGWIRAEGTIRTIRVIAPLALAAVLLLAGSAAATPLDYTFSGSNQGWQQAQDQAVGPTGPARFLPSGGNPGGRLTATDMGSDSGCPNSTPCHDLTLYSPFVPKLGANYGGTASFDLRSNVNPGFGAELLLLPEGPEYLDGLIPTSEGAGYHTLSIRLDETANWAVCAYAGGACTPPSQIQFHSLIAASDLIGVMVDVAPANVTGDTYDLDNVVLTDGGPQPPPGPGGGPPPHKKPKKCKKKQKKHRAASAKKRKCKKKRRAATPALRG